MCRPLLCLPSPLPGRGIQGLIGSQPPSIFADYLRGSFCQRPSSASPAKFSLYICIFFLLPPPVSLKSERAISHRPPSPLLSATSPPSCCRALVPRWGSGARIIPPTQQGPRNTLIMEQVFFFSLFLINWGCRHSTRWVRRDQSVYLSLPSLYVAKVFTSNFPLLPCTDARPASLTGGQTLRTPSSTSGGGSLAVSSLVSS